MASNMWPRLDRHTKVVITALEVTVSGGRMGWEGGREEGEKWRGEKCARRDTVPRFVAVCSRVVDPSQESGLRVGV